MPVDVRRAGDRYESRGELVVSRHSFSFGPHYDPANTRFGPLVAHNEELLQPGGQFPEHAHRDLDIVTWVVAGALMHTDDAGGAGLVLPGAVGYLHTGAGVRHHERNASPGVTRFVQMWLVPDAVVPPSFAVVPAGSGAAVSSRAAASSHVAVYSGSADAGVVLLASGSPADRAPITLRCTGARLLLAQVAAGDGAELAAGGASLAHLFVARGAITLTAAASDGAARGSAAADGAARGGAAADYGARGSAELAEGDAARVTDVGRLRVEAAADAQLLVWFFDAADGPNG